MTVEPENTPERQVSRERLEAIRDWDSPKYSTGVHVSRQETVQMASRVLAAEAENSRLLDELAEARQTIKRLQDRDDYVTGCLV